MMFHGSFAKKADAVAKEKKTPGAFVRGTLTNAGYRYLVMSPRKNPIKRRANRSTVTFDSAVQKYLATSYSQKYGNVYAHGYTKKEAAKNLRDRLRALRKGAIDPHTWQASGSGYYAGNPHEVMIMGANPTVPYAVLFRRHGKLHTWERLADTATQATMIARDALAREYPDRDYQLISVKPIQHSNPDHGSREITIPPGSTITIRTGPTRRNPSPTEPQPNVELGTYENGIFQPWTRRPKTRQKRAIHRGRARNPSAESIRESFTGAPVDFDLVVNEPHMPRGDYAQLGEVLALHVKPVSGGQVQAIEFTRPRPLLVSDESARQLYFVGGDQDLDDSLMVFNPRDRGRGVYELGEARRIDYKQRKEHVPNPSADEWRHTLGEETGERPIVLYDSNCRRILLEGGAYVVRPEGIVN